MGYRDNGEDDRRFARCARCDAMVFAELAGSCHTNATIVCDLCGIAIPDLPVVDSDYFNVGYESWPSPRACCAVPPREITIPPYRCNYSHRHPPSSRRFRLR